jgi:hypothetical protein
LDAPIALIYAIIFAWIILKAKFFKLDGIPSKYIFIVFLLKIIAGTVLYFVYTYYYEDRSTADIFKYFDDSKVMYDALFDKPIDFFKMLFSVQNDNAYFDATYYVGMNHWYRVFENNLYNDSHTIIRLNAFFRLFSFGSYHAHTVFMCFLSLTGLVYLYKFFKHFILANKQLLFLVVFMVPSVILWASGVLKEGLLLFGLGVMLYFFKNLITEKMKIRNLILMHIGILILLYIKFYTLIAILMPLLAFFLVYKFKIKRVFLTYSSLLVLSVIVGVLIKYLYPAYDPFQMLSLKQQDFFGLAQSMDAGSVINAPILENSVLSFLKNIPFALHVVFLRPFFFESLNPLMLAAGLENLLIILLFIIGIFARRKKLLSDNLFMFCFSFVLILYVLIGLTTPVIGAVVRYKVPALPFLFLLLILMIDIQKLKKIFPQLKFKKDE